MSSNNNINNKTQTTCSDSASVTSSAVAKSFFDNLPIDENERRQYIHQFKMSIKLEKRKLKELSGEKKCKKSKDKHYGFGFNGHYAGIRIYGQSYGCSDSYQQEQTPGQFKEPIAHPYDGFHGKYHGYYRHHGKHYGHHGYKNVDKKICKLTKKKQILIAKTQYIESKIAILSQKPKEETTTAQSTTAAANSPIGSIVEDFKNF